VWVSNDMLARASFRNFKGLKDVDIDLAPFTVFVGKNGAGKTSILQGIHYASQVGVRRAGEDESPTGRLGLLLSGSRDPRRLLTWPGRGALELSLTDTDGSTLSLSAELLADDAEGTGCQFHAAMTGEDSQAIHMPGADPKSVAAFFRSPVLRRFASAVYLHLDARVMAQPSAASAAEPRVEHDGEGLASVLNYLAGADPATIDVITQDLARIVPDVRGIRTFPASLTRRRREKITVGEHTTWTTIEEEVPGHRLSLEFEGGRIVPADLLSEGTVVALGLVTVLRQPRCPRLVLLDDLDRALHPEAQAELARCLREIRSARPEVQILCTSHSPYLLDQFEIAEVRITAQDAEGNTVCRPLGEHPEIDRWRRLMRGGELWASVGEDWILGRGDR
jgi:predicted ATPase